MTSMSYTAPRISPEQEAHEIAALSPEERLEIQNDVCGTNNSGNIMFEQEHDPNDSTEAKSQRTLQEMEKLSEMEKAEYLEALEKCPNLVEKESHPIRFLRAERYSPELAAKRLAAYWKMRKTIFGKDHAFLPMVLGKGGCLTEEEETFLADHGDISTHPLPDDVHGRGAIFFDRTRVTSDNMKNLHKLSLIRICWYEVHAVLVEREERLLSQKDGTTHPVANVADFVLLANARLSTLNQFQRQFVKLQYDSFKKALPVRLCAFHLVATAVTCSFALPMMKFVLGHDIRMRLRLHEETRFFSQGGYSPCQIHQKTMNLQQDLWDNKMTSSKKRSLSEALEEYGFPKDCLPRSMGGTFVFRGREWVAQQKDKEHQGVKQEEQVAHEALFSATTAVPVLLTK